MNKDLFDLYTDYLICSTEQTTATQLSRMLDGDISHDQVTRFLSSQTFSSKDLWKLVRPTLRQIESDEGVLISMTPLLKNSGRMKMKLFVITLIIVKVAQLKELTF